MRKIVVLDGYAGNPGDLSWSGLQQLAPCDIWDHTAPELVVPRCQGAEMVLTNKVALRADVIEQLPDLRYIGVMATGFNIIDNEVARQRGITVTNVPAYSTMSVAQLVIAHLLNITDHVQHYTQQAHDGVWSHCGDFSYMDVPIVEVADKLMGIVGLGQIGSAVARIAQALGMRVMAVTSKPQEQLPAGVMKAQSLDDMLRQADVVTLHCPLTPENRRMINAERLALMKPSAILINTARGALIDDQAVGDALNAGRLAAYATDVMDPEPPADDNPLITARNSFFTPHIGWASYDARVRLMDVITSNAAAYLAGKPVNVVN